MEFLLFLLFLTNFQYFQKKNFFKFLTKMLMFSSIIIGKSSSHLISKFDSFEHNFSFSLKCDKFSLFILCFHYIENILFFKTISDMNCHPNFSKNLLFFSELIFRKSITIIV